MSTRPIGWLAASILIASLWAVHCPAAEDSRSRERHPNIVFILADDLGYGDLGCYGQARILTPRLDQMAREGIRFTQCYAGTTVCAPSRSCLMTGQHSGHTRVRGNDRHPLLPEDLTVAEVLKGAGYRTALIGKWGLGDPDTTGAPNKQGFDQFFGYTDQRHAHNYFPSYLWRNGEKVLLPNKVSHETPEGAGVATERIQYSHDLFVKEALAFLERSRGDPFFLYLALTLPHANNEAGKRGMEITDPNPYASANWPEPERNKAAMITRLDRDVGRVLDKLDELNLTGNTVVFFTSDNGPHREGGVDPAFFQSSGPFRGIKRDLYEGGIRVPMLVRWPGVIRAGRVNDLVWAFWDFLPTAAAIADVKPPGNIDGISVWPTIRGRLQSKKHEFLYWEFHEGGSKQAVRMGDWKAIRFGVDQPVELYDLRKDPSETRNVAGRNVRVVRKIEDYLRNARTESEWWPLKSGSQKPAVSTIIEKKDHSL